MVQSLRTKCEKLIEIDNYLQVRMQLFTRLFSKYCKILFVWYISLPVGNTENINEVEQMIRVENLQEQQQEKTRKQEVLEVWLKDLTEKKKL